MTFINKVVLIVGAGSGLGEATALKFAKSSARLSLVDIREDILKKSADTCEKVSKVKILKIAADVTKDVDVKRIVEVTLKEYGRIDVLVNCANVVGTGTILGGNIVESFDKLEAVNLRGAIALTQATAPALIESKGNVVNVSGECGIKPMPQVLPYAVTKAGLEHFTRCAALELATHGVRVNAVVPGPVRSNMISNGDSFGKLVKFMPLKKELLEEDVSSMVLFLASDDARCITGSSYVVDGGSMLIPGGTTSKIQ